MRLLISAMALAAISIASCNKDKNFKTATVINTGDITTDGCGYVLKMDNQELLKPLNLPSAYMHEGMAVKVKYHGGGDVQLCSSQDKKQYLNPVYVDDIKKVN